jgi:hypothetical protein
MLKMICIKRYAAVTATNNETYYFIMHPMPDHFDSMHINLDIKQHNLNLQTTLYPNQQSFALLDEFNSPTDGGKLADKVDYNKERTIVSRREQLIGDFVFKLVTYEPYENIFFVVYTYSL